MTKSHNPTVLVVDDNEAALYAKSRVLGQAGFVISQARTGTDAIEIAIEAKPMVVLLDWLLPDIKGLEVCRRLKSHPATVNTMVLAISAALTEAEDRVRGLENGADGYLVDPISPAELVANVRALARVSEREQQIRQLIAERDELLRAAEEARREAEMAVRAKDEFLAVVSHELRNPLNAMIGWLRILNQPGGATPDTLAKAIAVLDRNVEQQRQLIEDLLDTSRIVSGKLKLELGTTDLVQVTQDAVEVVRAAAAARGITMRTVIGSQLGTIVADAARVRQVAWNLLSNAVKFTPAGGTVELRVEQLDRKVRMVVSDTGRGISADFLPHVFELFQQFDSSSTRRHGGLGLGLALTKHLVELHGGEIRAESAGEGLGSTFTIELPIHPLVETTSLAGVRSDLAGDRASGIVAEVSLGDVRVLAIDDEEATCDLLAELLQRAGAKVTTVLSSQAALDLLQEVGGEIPFDVAICDIGMPGQDGYTLIERLRALETARGVGPAERLPAIALTAYTRPQDRIRALQAGFQMHLAKPIEPDELILVIDKLVRGAGSRAF